MLDVTPVEGGAVRSLVAFKTSTQSISLRFPSESVDALDGPTTVVAILEKAVLPAVTTIKAHVPASSVGANKVGSAQIVASSSSSSSPVVVGEIVFSLPESVAEGESSLKIELDVEMNIEGGVTVRARNGESVMEEVTIPVA